ncbi:hypothetical protein KF840_12960 [bacterium]|nr:hypothetical protein [bacterium]
MSGPRPSPGDLAGDLRSTFRYGMGAASAAAHALPLSPPSRSLRAAWLGELARA